MLSVCFVPSLQCFESLFNDEEIQVHHRLPRSLGGNNSYSNLVLVHLLCHQQIHAKAKWAMDECQKDNDREVLAAESSITHRSKLKEKSESLVVATGFSLSLNSNHPQLCKKSTLHSL